LDCYEIMSQLTVGKQQERSHLSEHGWHNGIGVQIQVSSYRICNLIFVIRHPPDCPPIIITVQMLRAEPIEINNFLINTISTVTY